MKKKSRIVLGIVIFIYSVLMSINIVSAKGISSPVIIEAKEKTVQSLQELIISGLTAKGTNVLIYINNEYSGEAVTKEKNSLLDEFIFKINKTFGLSGYEISAVARNPLTQELSAVSNIAIAEIVKNNVSIPVQQSPTNTPIVTKKKIVNNTKASDPEKAITKNEKTSEKNLLTTGGSAVSDKNEQVSINKNKEQVEISGKGADDSKRVQEKNSAIMNIKDILSPEKNINASGSGLTDENMEVSGKIKMNLIIFIVFLLAIIVWIFWVNQELIKEKQNADRESNDKKE